MSKVTLFGTVVHDSHDYEYIEGCDLNGAYSEQLRVVTKGYSSTDDHGSELGGGVKGKIDLYLRTVGVLNLPVGRTVRVTIEVADISGEFSDGIQPGVLLKELSDG